MKWFSRLSSFLVCVILLFCSVFTPVAHASNLIDRVSSSVQDWLAGWSGQNTGMWNAVDPLMGMWTVNKPQKYYTTPTSSVEDKYGNVTNYYRGGDTTTTNIIDSYNKTFNTIHNTTNNTTTNNYKANVRLENFLNQYTTNNNNYTYSADFKSWYYDNTTNNYNYNQFTKNDYTQNNLYYNQDNSRYYISIDNSTDEYYLIDVQYSPTFVTVNYTYNTTNINNEKVGDVTNVYYYELKDGRNSSTLTAAEVAGLDVGYEADNYELVTDDPNTLSLQHFDGDYTDSSSYNRTFYSQNRSTNYVDSGAFGKAVSLPNGSAAGVTIPGLSGYDRLSFDFRVYFNDISSLGIYFGDTNIFQEIVTSTRKWIGRDIYSDNGNKYHPMGYVYFSSNISLSKDTYYDWSYLSSYITHPLNAVTGAPNGYDIPSPSSTYRSQMIKPDHYLSSGFEGESTYSKKFGWMTYTDSKPSGSNKLFWQYIPSVSCFIPYDNPNIWQTQGYLRHYTDYEYRWSPSQYVLV